MTFAGMSAAAWASGMAAITAALIVLHLLRVRHRRLAVETLLFFRMAETPSRPRVLLGRPARWWSFVLGLLAASAVWTAVADPVILARGPSRFVAVILPSSGAAAAEGQGESAIGPHGRQFLMDGRLASLADSGEPRGRRDDRLARAHAVAPGGAVDDACEAVRALAVEGDRVRIDGLRTPLTRIGAAAVDPPAWVIGDAPLPRAESRPNRVATPITIANGVPGAVRLAIEADGRFVMSETEAALAEVRVDREGQGHRPALVIDAGDGAADRDAIATADLPLPLALHDRHANAAPALRLENGESVWVRDAISGAPLVTARSGQGSTGGPRVRVVRWLIEPAAHRDVPVIVSGTLALLTGLARPALVQAGETVVVPALTTDALRIQGSEPLTVLAAGGRYRWLPRLAGSYRLDDGSAATTCDVIPSATVADRASAADAAADPVADPLRPGRWLVLAALLLVLLDWWLFRRGAVP